MAKGHFTSIETTSAHAEGLLTQGRYGEAEVFYRELAAQTHILDYEYDDWLRRLGEIYEHLNRDREASYVYLYLHYFDRALRRSQGDGRDADRARIYDVNKDWNEAAPLYERAGMVAHSAIALGKANRAGDAAERWKQLAGDSHLTRPYENALVQFNVGMALADAGDQSGAAHRALVDSQRQLEQVADDFEAKGERERAFDCYQILLKIGRDSGQYENLAEGYLNCIRVLKHDNLKFYVLQYYEDFIRLSLERGELVAAATLYQEAADYSAGHGLPYHRHYQGKVGETWVLAASKYADDGAPIDLTENALLASIRAYSGVGDFEAVQRNFQRLAKLDLSEAKAHRYEVISARYAGAGRDVAPAPEFPEYLKKHHAYADIWFLDLIEWELDGDPRSVAVSMIGDLTYPDGIRRRALVVALTLGAAEQRDIGDGTETLERVAELLGELQSYAALRPLEQLFERGDVKVRQASVRALRFLFFKRSFTLIRKALVDPERGVRAAALDALRGLHFPHAFNPLARIYQETEDEVLQAAALESIGHIQSVEAGEFLLGVLRQEQGPLRDAAHRALNSLDNADLTPILRQYQEIEADPGVRAILENLLQPVHS